jgi:hypothetical protein
MEHLLLDKTIIENYFKHNNISYRYIDGVDFIIESKLTIIFSRVVDYVWALEITGVDLGNRFTTAEIEGDTMLQIIRSIYKNNFEIKKTGIFRTNKSLFANTEGYGQIYIGRVKNKLWTLTQNNS